MSKDQSNKPPNKSFEKKDKKPNANAFWDFWAPLFLTIGLYSGIRHFVAEARYIPSGSMLPGLQINDRLLVEKLTFRTRSPKRGEIVVFNSPYSFNKNLINRRSHDLPSSLKCAVLTFPLINFVPGIGDSACDAYIKRVVAIGGDMVLINSRGETYVNGQLLDEPYVSSFCKITSESFGNCKTLNTVVPSSNVLVLGDNRKNSWDSRFWPDSPFLPEEEIIGRAVWRFWPIRRIGILTP